MNVDFDRVVDEDIAQYKKLASTHLWVWNYTKNNYPGHPYSQKDFKELKSFFITVFENDWRESLTIYEYRMFFFLIYLQKSTQIHTLKNLFVMTRLSNSRICTKVVEQLEKKGYIRITRNFTKGQILKKPLHRLFTKIDCLDPLGKIIKVDEIIGREYEEPVAFQRRRIRIQKKRETKSR